MNRFLMMTRSALAGGDNGLATEVPRFLKYRI